MFEKVNQILYLAKNKESKKKIDPNGTTHKKLEEAGTIISSIWTLSKSRSRYKKGGDYFASKRAIEFFKLFKAHNISMIAYFFITFTIISAFCFYLLYRIQTKRLLPSFSLKILTIVWALLTAITVFYKCAYQTSVILGVLTAENALFNKLLNTFAHLVLEIFDSISPGVIYEKFEHNITYIIYTMMRNMILCMEGFEMCLVMISIISIFIPWFAAALLALMICMLLLKVIDCLLKSIIFLSNRNEHL